MIPTNIEQKNYFGINYHLNKLTIDIVKHDKCMHLNIIVIR